ncbi:MAG: hypothetical protein JXD22_12835 [Sedimentisphaerales bacterium]|nr:hypothetical protein [Sedimentisphaerales bacterium]
MAAYLRFFVALAALLLLVGCFNLEMDKPLVDLGDSSADYQAPRTQDPAPGQPDSELTRQQRMQRDLAQCEQLVVIKEKKCEKLEEELDNQKDRYKDQIKELEDKIKDLEKENRNLRKKVRDLESGN